MGKNVESEQKDHRTLLLELEEKKLYYKQKRQPILWYWALVGFVLIIVVLTGICAYLLNAFLLGVISFFSFFGCIFLVGMFFPKDYNGPKNLDRERGRNKIY